MDISTSRRILLLLAASLVALVMAVPPVSAQINPLGGGTDPGNPNPNPPGGGKGGKNAAKCEKVEKPAHVRKCHKRR